MCISRIDTPSQQATAIARYQKAQTRLLMGQICVPIIGGIVGGIGLLLLDFNAWVVNKIYVRAKDQAQFAKDTYSRPMSKDNYSSGQMRVFSVLNVLTCGLPGLIILSAIAIIQIQECCCSNN